MTKSGGVSNKLSANAGGSFGFGKAAYFYISPIRTILVSTLTEDGDYFFEGVSSLCTHYDNENMKCVSVGYYDNNDGQPVEDENNIPIRFRRDEIGTDICIMGVEINSEADKEAIYSEMTIAVLQNFWLAIYHGKLDVTVGDIEITEDNIVQMIEKYFPEIHDNSRKLSKFNPRPYLEVVANVNTDKNHVLYEEELPTLGHVQFYGFKIKDGSSRVALLRSPRMFVQSRQVPSADGFYGVFFCENPEGDAILRHIENPAHNEWMPSNWKNERGKTVPDGKHAFREMKEFLIRCMEKLTERANRETLNIRGLDQYLYIPTAVEDDKDDYMNESYLSDPTGEFKDDGASITTDSDQTKTSDVLNDENLGKILVGRISTAKEDPKGELLSGKGKHRSTEGGGGVGHEKINRRNKPEEDAVDGSFAYEIPVRYRTFAQKEKDSYIHKIIIHPEYDVPDGRIDLLIGSDQSDESINIVSSSKGVVEGNSISKLHIAIGKNVLEIKFADDMPHAIKLDAYEIK